MRCAFTRSPLIVPVIEAVASTVAAARELGSREESCPIPREGRNCAILAFIRNSVFNSRTGGTNKLDELVALSIAERVADIAASAPHRDHGLPI